MSKYLILFSTLIMSSGLWAARFSDDDTPFSGRSSVIWALAGSYIIYAAIAIGLFLVYRLMKGLGRTKVTGKTIALTAIQTTQDSKTGELVVMTGRIVGLMAWILSKLGLDATYHLSATSKGVSLKESNIVGENKTYLPGSMISEVYCAYSRDANWLFYALALVGLAAYCGISLDTGIVIVLFFLIVAGLCAYLFYASKKLLFYVATPSSSVWIRFSEGIFEGVQMDFVKLSEIAKNLCTVYHNVQTGTGVASKAAR